MERMNDNKKGTYFQSQLEAVASAACLARVRRGNVSPVKIQIPGAQVLAYPRMNKQAYVQRTAKRQAVNEAVIHY